MAQIWSDQFALIFDHGALRREFACKVGNAAKHSAVSRVTQWWRFGLIWCFSLPVTACFVCRCRVVRKLPATCRSGIRWASLAPWQLIRLPRRFYRVGSLFDINWCRLFASTVLCIIGCVISWGMLLKMGRSPALIRRPWHCDGPEGLLLLLFSWLVPLSWLDGSDKLNKVHRTRYSTSKVFECWIK